VIFRPDQLSEPEPEEILVAPSASTSWTPVFSKIGAAFLDVGGTMCHAAIVAREYRLPAVVGTGSATTRIGTGDLLHVDAVWASSRSSRACDLGLSRTSAEDSAQATVAFVRQPSAYDVRAISE
jgi:phosphoenolpyruvate synthase/pyruvate phosphate dikinase